MNYDPIHDSFTDTASNDSTAPATSNSAVNTNVTDKLDTSPTRKALSISSLVDAASNSVGLSKEIDDHTEGENDGEEEMGIDDGDADTSISHSKKKTGSKGKKASSSLPKGIRHLKKSDGEPFWRRDIQYDFLRELFDDQHEVFTNYFPYCDIPAAKNDPKLTFSELYIRTLAESGKCSKILKERLLKDNEMGKSVGKVCLLVNAGRMNTTINFVPEMRSSLRTYHSIPSLQADPVYGGSKPLQDTPRLKSILKAVCDGEEVKSIDDILEHPKLQKPNTNVIQLIFLLSGNIKSIKYLHDENTSEENNNFMEFFLNSRIHPKNRARRFLWLIYTYLETSFQPEELENNPFNSNTIPEIEYIDSDAVDDFDKDTDFEIEYSEKMYRTRLGYLADEEHNNNPKRGNKSKKDREPEETDEVTYVEDGNENKTDHDDIDQQNQDVNDLKRTAPVDDSKSRKRKGKRNPVLHNTVVSSPLTKNVITFSLDNTKNPNDVDMEGDEIRDGTEQPQEIRERSNEMDDNYSTDNVNQIEFPVKGLDEILKRYLGSNIAPMTPDNSVSITTRQNIVAKSKQVIRQIKNSSKVSGAEFEKKVDKLIDWIFRYFQYKKSSANGLLGMEWESIRYDLINGLESYLYQQFGKTIGNQKFHQPSSKKGDSNLSNIVAGQMDLSSIEKVGFGFVATHDFSRSSEMESFMLDLISLCNDWIESNEDVNEVDIIKYNLEDESVTFINGQ